MLKKIVVATAFLSLTACSSGGDEIVFDTALGPVTKQQIETLPPNLQGDADNANYLPSEKKGASMESLDGTDE